jgi:hypothetical protein
MDAKNYSRVYVGTQTPVSTYDSSYVRNVPGQIALT